MTEYLFKLPPSSTGTLQSRIQEMMVSAITNHHVKPGSPLPSGRKLAKQLKVARNTVVLAYQNLVDEGFIESRQRSGFYVCLDVLDGYAKSSVKKDSNESEVNWNEIFSVRPGLLPYIQKPTQWQQYPYAFLYGQYDKEIFPISDWRDCCRDAASVPAIYDWAADYIDQDNPTLIEQIQTKLLPRRGIFVDADEILVTVGAQNAIFLAAQLLLDKDKTVGMENPGYVDARNTFLTQTNNLVSLDMDDQGLVVDDHLNACDCVYVTPSHQFPTTLTLPEERRKQLLEKASEHDFILIEDDYESELRYHSHPAAALKSEDDKGRVIYIGSISKTLAPGIRLGYMVAPRRFIEEARVLRRLVLRHPPSNNQYIIARFLQRGYHDSLIRKLSQTLDSRSRVMAKALDKHLPGASPFTSYGGSSRWIKGPDGLDSRKLAEDLIKEGVLIEPGDVFFYPTAKTCPFFRLGFSSLSETKIAEGISKIAAAINRSGWAMHKIR